jgi:hypothetical protein
MTPARAPLQIVTLLLLLTLGAARAETVYRCTGPQGTQYGQQPCPGGQALNVQDDRNDEQRRSAQEAAAREAVLAERMTLERERRDARIRPAQAIGIHGERGTGGVRPASAPAPMHKASAAKPSKKKKKAASPIKQPA